MNALVPVTQLPPGVLTTAEMAATMSYAEAEKAEATRAAYASDWKDFASGARPSAPRRTLVSLPPICPTSPIEAANRAPSVAGRRRSPIATSSPGSSHRPVRRR